MKLADVASKIEVSEDVINILNAELRYKTTPNREYELKIPKDSIEKFNLVYNDIPEAEKTSFTNSRPGSLYIKHRVRPGETVASIAKRYRVSTQSIFESNRINKNKRLAKGKIIRIPVANRIETANVREKQTDNRNAARKTAGAVQAYKVKPGDSVLGIAKRFHVPAAKLKEINNLKTNSIQAGRTLKIPCTEAGDNSDEKPVKETNSAKSAAKQNIVGKTLTAKDVAKLGSNKHIVTKGENLSIIAKKYDIEVAKLIKMNNLAGDDSLTPGQVLVVKK
jgi:membrane-bound lytic murein transglycosylase D